MGRAALPSAQPSRYLVGFPGRARIPASVLAASGGRVVDSIPAFHVLVVQGVRNPAALRRAKPAFIEPEFETTVAPIRAAPTPGRALAVPGQAGTPWYASGVQWDMRAMRADSGWAMSDGGSGTRICIVDTGVDSLHQELDGGKVLLSTNFVTTEPRTDDPNGHGSHVAGEAAARGVVVSGVAPRASLLSARVLNAAGSGTESAIVNGIVWCADNGAHVINVSIGGIVLRGTVGYVLAPIVYGLAVDYARSSGAVVVVAAGNFNLRLPNPAQLEVPAQVPGTIVVGATGPLTRSTAPPPPAWDPFDPSQVWRGPDHKAEYSNFGLAVDVFAPGGRGNVPLSEPYRFHGGVPQGGPDDQIWSVCSGESDQIGAANAGGVPGPAGSCLNSSSLYIPYAGTSMAAPHVSGMAAVLYEALGGLRSAANRDRVERCIRTTTDVVGPAKIYGGGRVNVKKALEALESGTC
jgi:subtilisin family serine protease